MIASYIAAAAISLLIIFGAYWAEFSFINGLGIIPDASAWGNFGSYVGGLAGPALSFISLLFLIKTLTLQNEALKLQNLTLRAQNEANDALKEDALNNRKAEKLRSFSDLFFNLISTQRTLLDKFSITFLVNGVSVTKGGVEAIMEIEKEVSLLRQANVSHDGLRQYIEQIDSIDQIYGILRAFYISVKLISEKLSEEQGFSGVERRDFFNTLINLTDFSHVRLILLAVQFIDKNPADYLRRHSEFVSVLQAVGLALDPY